MEPLFRLKLLRPAIEQDPENPSIELSSGTALQASLIGLGGNDLREKAIQLATAFVQSPDFIGDPRSNPLDNELTGLSKALDELEAGLQLSVADIKTAVQQSFGQAPAMVAADQKFKDTWSNLADSLLAIKVSRSEHNRSFEALVRQLRDMELINTIVSGTIPDTPQLLRRKRRRSLKLPTELRFEPDLSTKKEREKAKKEYEASIVKRRGAVEGLVDKHNKLRGALNELANLRAGQFRSVASSADPGVAEPLELGVDRLDMAELTFNRKLRELQLRSVEKSIEVMSRVADTTGLVNTATIALDKGEGAPTRPLPKNASPKFAPPDPKDTGFVLSKVGVAALSDKTREVAKDFGLDIEATAVDEISGRMEKALAETATDLDMQAGQASKFSYRRVGNALITIETPIASSWNYVGVGGFIPNIFNFLDGRVPHTKGDVLPTGVADLLIVRQHLIGYQRADVAHIENVLKGERKLREHTRREETQIVTLSESELSTAEERELESTDRFEMTKETSKTLKEDAKFKAGLKVSGKYGPTVEFSASAEGSLQRTKEEASKSASKFSQDVTERSSQKIAERVLERITRTTTSETIEKNTHELNNVGDGGNISGVYQWVNKVYEAQMYNYGLRAMFDFMVPEPAAFLIQTLREGHSEALHITKPPSFNLKPENLSESNFGHWVKVFGATDVSAPPSLFRTVSTDYSAGGGDSSTDYTHSAQLAIEEGYRAIYASAGVAWNQWNGNAAVDIVIGRRGHRIKDDGSWFWTTNLDNEEASIPIALTSFRMSDMSVAIEIKCQRTDRAIRNWQLDTHAKLRQAHTVLVADYEEKLAQLEMQAGVAIEGRNPSTNLNMIEDELKKNCISILTDQHFDLFNAIETDSGTGYEQINVFEAEGEGAYVRFFEQAFEWENMTWVNYPYFWGRKEQWDERMSYDDPDPVFNEFLRAGYARVSIPARPGFEGAIDHYLTFGETWVGGPLPTVSGDLYLPIADEIAERLDRPGSEIPQGDPWTVHVPTSLVKLRDDDNLPQWAKDQNGNWTEL